MSLTEDANQLARTLRVLQRIESGDLDDLTEDESTEVRETLIEALRFTAACIRDSYAIPLRREALQ